MVPIVGAVRLVGKNNRYTMKYEKIILIGAFYMLAKVSLRTDYDSLISEISAQHGNSSALVKAIIKRESNFNPLAHNTSGEDSRGLGQINAGTAIALGYVNLNDLFDPATNIEAINRLLDDLKKRYDHILDIISAYNAGRPLINKDGFYINSQYVLKVYSRYLAYSVLML